MQLADFAHDVVGKAKPEALGEIERALGMILGIESSERSRCGGVSKLLSVYENADALAEAESSTGLRRWSRQRIFR